MKSTIKTWKAVALAALLTAVMLLSSGCFAAIEGGGAASVVGTTGTMR